MFNQVHRTNYLWFIPVIVILGLLAFSPITAAPDFQDDVNPLLGEMGQTFTEVYDRVSPSVVAINVVARQDAGLQGDIPQQSGGSGFVFDTEGHIITNNHVVDGATRIEVNFLDGTIARAEIIGLDPDSDLAVIKVDLPEDRLFPVEFADSDGLLIGQPVLAIGSPFGQRWTLTSGIISALDRTIQGLTQFSIGGVIQTDTAINPGNSGGPLLDLEGRVIGVNSQIQSAVRSSSGVGFAVPGNLTQRVARQLIDNGYMDYSYLGISGNNISLSVIEALELPNDTRGVVVAEAVAGGPAARAGIQSIGETTEIDGLEVPVEVDIITGINGREIHGMSDLVTYLANSTSPGDTVTLDVLRNGEEQLTLEVRLTPRP